MPVDANLRDLSHRPDRYFEIVRDEMLAFVRDDAARILEIGCGMGSFGLALKKSRAAEVWGIEIDAPAAEAARERLDRVLTGDAFDLLGEVPDGFFDSIVCNDVLEHVVDPYGLLLGLSDKLAPGGEVTCSIPNVRYFRVLRGLLFRKDWKYEESGVLDKTHLRFFTERSIRVMFETLGYEVLELRGINPTRNRTAHWISRLSFGWLADIVFLEFACRARPRR